MSIISTINSPNWLSHCGKYLCSLLMRNMMPAVICCQRNCLKLRKIKPELSKSVVKTESPCFHFPCFCCFVVCLGFFPPCFLYFFGVIWSSCLDMGLIILFIDRFFFTSACGKRALSSSWQVIFAWLTLDWFRWMFWGFV